MKLSQSLINNWVIKFNFHLWLYNRERSTQKKIIFNFVSDQKVCERFSVLNIIFHTHSYFSCFSVTLFLFFRTWNLSRLELFFCYLFQVEVERWFFFAFEYYFNCWFKQFELFHFPFLLFLAPFTQLQLLIESF